MVAAVAGLHTGETLVPEEFISALSPLTPLMPPKRPLGFRVRVRVPELSGAGSGFNSSEAVLLELELEQLLDIVPSEMRLLVTVLAVESRCS